MSLSLPGNYLYCLSRDNLPPEKYECIISANAAWARICREYEFDDGNNAGRYLINMRERQVYSNHTRSPGNREKGKLERMIFSGDVVMLSNMHGPATLFYINEEGRLNCTDSSAFRLNRAEGIIRAYNASVKQRDYQRIGGNHAQLNSH